MHSATLILELVIVADRPLDIWGDERLLELGQAQWTAMQAGTWDSSLSKQAQVDLERQRSSATLTPGQQKALAKALRKEGEPGYERGAKPKL